MKLFLILLLFTFAEINDITLEDIKGEKIKLLNLNKKVYAIYHTGWSCKDCFAELENAISSFDSSAYIITITQCTNSIIDKREREIILKSLVKNRNFYYLTNITNQNISLIKKNKFERSPFLIYYDSSKQILIPYDSLFSIKRDKQQLAKYIQSYIGLN